MSMGDFPYLPEEMIPRVYKLADKVRSGEVGLADLGQAVVPPVLTKLLPPIMPILMKEAGPQIAEALPELLPAMVKMMPAMMGHELFLKVGGIGYFIVSIGTGGKLFSMKKSSFKEIKAAKIPGIYIDLDLIPMFFQGMNGIIAMLGEDLIKMYGVDEMMEWTAGAEMPPNMSGMLDMIMPFLAAMLTKENLEMITKPYQEIGAEVLEAFGV